MTDDRRDHASSAGHPWHLIIWALAGASFLIAVDIWTTGFGPGLVHETGGIEVASALLYAYAAIAWLWTRPGENWKTSWQVPAIMLLMMGREFDLDKKLTSIGVLRSDLYLTDMAPVLDRILGLIALAFVATVAIRLVKMGAKEFVAGLRMRTLWAWSIVGALAFAILSKAADGIGRKLAPFGITLESGTSLQMVILEELLELGIPLMLLVAVISSTTRVTRSSRTSFR